MRYTKKPITIDAIQWTGDNYVQIAQFCDKAYYDTVLKIQTLEGTMKTTIGDFIIKGIKGEFYPCKPDIFEMTYDKVEPTDIK